MRPQMLLHDGTAHGVTERHHLETTRCGVVRGRRLLLIIDAAVYPRLRYGHAVLLHQLNAEYLSENEGANVDDDL
ncbi:MAG: hypothetical protein QOI25_1911 [Mycobacterium sp.]|nr:hypothetical protein [Mycobacterium sp.]